VRGAARAFAGAGYAATSMEDIAAAAGITKLIVYRHFDSKEDLYRAVLERVFERQAQLFLDSLSDDGAPTGTVRALLTVAREHPDGFRLLWRHAAREAPFAAYADELRGHAVGAARTVVLAAAPDVPVEWAAQTLFDMLVDAVLDWLDHGDGDDERFVALTGAALRAVVVSWSRAPRPRDG
jgi:AcrR family transcriptional regulator